MKTYMPVMLDCWGRVCVVVGGGRVAERKVGELLACSAQVKVVSPEVTPVLRRHHEQGELEWIPRGYEAGDLAGAFMAHAAADDPEVNRRVAEEARARGFWPTSPTVRKRGTSSIRACFGGGGLSSPSRLREPGRMPQARSGKGLSRNSEQNTKHISIAYMKYEKRSRNRFAIRQHGKSC
ncbi:NAD(P)-dependent oxidoreductase [Paenibacillus sp. JTLBN-2024]